MFSWFYGAPVNEAQTDFNPIDNIQKSLDQKQAQAWQDTESYYAFLAKIDSDSKPVSKSTEELKSNQETQVPEKSKWRDYGVGYLLKKYVTKAEALAEKAFNVLDEMKDLNPVEKCKASLGLNSALKTLLNQIDEFITLFQADDEIIKSFSSVFKITKIDMFFHKAVYGAMKDEWERLEAQLHKYIRKLEQVKQELNRHLKKMDQVGQVKHQVEQGLQPNTAASSKKLSIVTPSGNSELEPLIHSPAIVGTHFSAESPSPGNHKGYSFWDKPAESTVPLQQKTNGLRS